MSKQKARWNSWFEGEGVSDDAFINCDQPLERLKGSVYEYEKPFEPAGVENWKALDDTATPGCEACS